MKASFLLVCFFCFVGSFCEATFLKHKAEGWHFYEDLKKETQKKHSLKKAAGPSDPVQELKAFKEEVERLKAIAVMKTTYKNVKAYMQIQKKLMTQASTFSSKLLEVLFTTPELDYTIKHPTSQSARHVYLDEENKRTHREIKKLSKTHGLFFFFTGRCPYCKHFAPIIKAFSKQYGWDVMAVSLDGSSLPEFPEALEDNGTAKRLNIHTVPALMAVNPETEEVIPLSYGMSSQDQIIQRIKFLIIYKKNPELAP